MYHPSIENAPREAAEIFETPFGSQIVCLRPGRSDRQKLFHAQSYFLQILIS